MLWLMARLRAKKRGVPFSIKVDEIVIPERCPALGIKLSRGRRSPMGHSPSLDRIVPSLGYVTGNIIVVSMKANLIKQDANPAELMRVAKFYAKLK
jgi:hypothetical protein